MQPAVWPIGIHEQFAVTFEECRGDARMTERCAGKVTDSYRNFLHRELVVQTTRSGNAIAERREASVS